MSSKATSRRPNAPAPLSHTPILPSMTMKRKEKTSMNEYLNWIEECEFILKEKHVSLLAKRARQPQIKDAFAAATPSSPKPKPKHLKFMTSPTPASATAEDMDGHRSSYGVWLRSTPFHSSIA